MKLGQTRAPIPSDKHERYEVLKIKGRPLQQKLGGGNAPTRSATPDSFPACAYTTKRLAQF